MSGLAFKCPVCGQETSKTPRPNYWNCWHKSGDHPLIQEYNQVLDEANERLSILKEQIEETRRWTKQPQPRYRVELVEVGDSYVSEVPKLPGIRIRLRLTNKEEKDAYMNRWGSISGSWDETRISVIYYHTDDGILTHTGGGWALLYDPTIITNEEWEQIQRGNIPERLWKHPIDS